MRAFRANGAWVWMGLVAMACATLAAGEEPAKKKSGGPPEFERLEFRSIGPAAGGRVTRVAGVPGDPLVYYVATASGGVWKSSDGGRSFAPIFDDQPISSIGAIAVAESDPNVVYVGAGEANIRGNVAAGNGIYRSTDAGKSWAHVWKQAGQIGTMAVHPRDAKVAYAAVLGSAFGPNPERGVYRTTDGGESWKRVLARDADTGASDVAIDFNNPRVLFAGLWQARRKPWQMTSGGPGSGLYRSSDGGESWSELTGKGLPDEPWGKVGVGVARSDSRRVYALIEAEKGGLFRSDDGGESWRLTSDHRALRQRAWYYSTLTIDPTNPEVVWFPQVPMLKTIDGGATVSQVRGFHHGDHHDLWIDPANPKRMIDGNDGGVDLTVDGENWWAPRLPISQFYNIGVDAGDPYWVGGTMQDLGTAAAPTRSLKGDGIHLGEWLSVGGGEAGDFAFDPRRPGVVWAGEYSGYLSRYDLATGQATNVSIYPFNQSGHGSEILRYRFQWTSPVLVSPHDSRRVYHGGNVLFRTTDDGQSWTAVSPDLTRNDKTKQQWSGGPITGDNTGVEVYGTIFALAESPREAGLLWAGSDDGLVHLSRDGGGQWENVTARIPGLPEWGTVIAIEASPHAAATAYVAVDNHRQDDPHPHLWRTTDYGKSWKSLAAGLPQDAYVRAVKEDPERPGLLFVGTEKGIALSRDAGATWQPLRLNLPTVAVADLEIVRGDLVAGTMGRSIWIFDDLTPIRDWSPAIAAKALHLFPPRPATAWRGGYSWGELAPGANPPGGASFDFYLKEKPKGDVEVEIVDVSGAVVRTLSSVAKKNQLAATDPDTWGEPAKPDLKAEAGLQRAVWDLRLEGAKTVAGVKVEGDPESGPRALPGRYTLRLVVDGQSAEQPLEVRLDPRVQTAPADLEARHRLARELRDAFDRVAVAIERLRARRDAARDLAATLGEEADRAELKRLLEAVAARSEAIEAELHNPKAQVTYDILAFKGGARLYSQLGNLAYFASDSDTAPPQGLRELTAARLADLARLEAEIESLDKSEVAAAEAEARRLALPHLPR